MMSLRFAEDLGGQTPAFHFESLDYTAVERRLDASLGEFPQTPASRLRTHQHAGGEFLVVLQGSLIVRIGDDEHLLEADDAIYFDACVLHGYRRKGSRRCRAIVVTTA